MSGFKLLPKNNIRSKVLIKIPLDFGKHETVSVDVTWKVISTSELKQIAEDLREEKATMHDILHANIINVEGFIDEAGENIAFTPDVLDQALEHRHALEAFAAALNEQFAGKPATESLRRKN